MAIVVIVMVVSVQTVEYLCFENKNVKKKKHTKLGKNTVYPPN